MEFIILDQDREFYEQLMAAIPEGGAQPDLFFNEDGTLNRVKVMEQPLFQPHADPTELIGQQEPPLTDDGGAPGQTPPPAPPVKLEAVPPPKAAEVDGTGQPFDADIHAVNADGTGKRDSANKFIHKENDYNPPQPSGAFGSR